MSDMIKYVVECDTWNGVVALFIICCLFALIVIAICYTLIKLVQILCRTITKFHDVHAKASVKEVSFEADLHK